MTIAISRRQLISAMALSAVSTDLLATPTLKLDKPVRIVVSYAAGSGTDQVARYVADTMSKLSGQPFIVTNAPGADGNIGASTALRSAEDMYTLLVSGSSTHAANAAIYDKLPFDPERDFTPLSALAYIPFVLLVNPERTKARTLKEFLSISKSGNQDLSFASPSVGSRIAGEQFKRLSGLNAVNVPYKASSAAMTDFLGGRIDYYFCDIATAPPQVAAGKAVALAVSTKQRAHRLPDIPTLAELGFPDFDVSSWMAIWSTTRSTPKAVSDQLANAISSEIQSAAGRHFLMEKGYTPATAGASELAALQSRDTQIWGEIIRSSGMAQSSPR